MWDPCLYWRRCSNAGRADREREVSLAWQKVMLHNLSEDERVPLTDSHAASPHIGAMPRLWASMSPWALPTRWPLRIICIAS